MQDQGRHTYACRHKTLKKKKGSYRSWIFNTIEQMKTESKIFIVTKKIKGQLNIFVSCSLLYKSTSCTEH